MVSIQIKPNCYQRYSHPKACSHKKCNKIESHGFCNASQQAYGACIYDHCINEHHQINVFILCQVLKH